MQKFFLWLKAIRAPFFSASLIAVLVGAAVAAGEQPVNLWAIIAALIIVVGNQAGANLINDYFDALGSDPVNFDFTPFSGGSRLIQNGVLPRRSYLLATVVAYAIGQITAIGLSIAYWNGWILILALAGLGLGVAYSATGMFGMGRGWGEVAVGLGFGPLAVLGSYLLQTNQLSWKATFAGIPVGLLVMGILILNEFPDYEADRSVGKRNWIVRAGGGVRAVWIYLVTIVLAYMVILAGVFGGFFPGSILISYFSIPLAVWIILKLWQGKTRAPEIIPALAGNIGLHFITGLLLCIGLLKH